MTRRGMLTTGAAVLAALAGCTNLPGVGGDGPRARTFDITIREESETLTATIEPKQGAEGVIQVNVDDDVTFNLENTLDHDVGVHNHVTDQEVTVEAGSTHAVRFTPTESEVGRHELEAFEEEAHQGDDHNETGSEDGHDDGEHEGVAVAVIEVRPQGS